MINMRTSKPKYRFFLGKYRPFFDDFFQVGPYTDFLRKYRPLYKLCFYDKIVKYTNFQLHIVALLKDIHVSIYAYILSARSSYYVVIIKMELYDCLVHNSS